MAAKKKFTETPAKIGFVKSMECLPVTRLPDCADWSYEIKLYRLAIEAIKEKGEVTPYSRRGNVLNRQFPYIAAALDPLPDDTILDGEVVALDAQGRSGSISCRIFARPNRQSATTFRHPVSDFSVLRVVRRKQ